MEMALILYLAIILSVLLSLVSDLVNVLSSRLLEFVTGENGRYILPARMFTPSLDSAYIRKLLGLRERGVTSVEVLSSLQSTLDSTRSISSDDLQTEGLYAAYASGQLVVQKVSGWCFSIYLQETPRAIIMTPFGLKKLHIISEYNLHELICAP
jgi:hypothetical protein